MSKYIDADRLQAEIERLIQEAPSWDDSRTYLLEVSALIDSLQQEQPEIVLEKEVIDYFEGHWPGMETAEQCNTHMQFNPPAIMRLVRHFYELGLNARKEK